LFEIIQPLKIISGFLFLYISQHITQRIFHFLFTGEGIQNRIEGGFFFFIKLLY